MSRITCLYDPLETDSGRLLDRRLLAGDDGRSCAARSFCTCTPQPRMQRGGRGGPRRSFRFQPAQPRRGRRAFAPPSIRTYELRRLVFCVPSAGRQVRCCSALSRRPKHCGRLPDRAAGAILLPVPTADAASLSRASLQLIETRRFPRDPGDRCALSPRSR